MDTKGLDYPSKCPNCGEPKTMKIKHPIYNEEIVVGKQCKCEIEAESKYKEKEKQKEKLKRLERLREYSLMDEGFKNCTFENFKVDENNKNLFTIAQNYCKQFNKYKKQGLGFTFHGVPGVGKTYLTFCMANYLLDRFVPVIAISTINLINRIYDSYGKFGDKGEAYIIRMLNNADLLILDDLGAEYGKEKTKQIIYSVIDSRTRNNKPMIITTNLTLPQLKEKLTGTDRVPRAYDRLIEMSTPLEVAGQSKRKEIAAKKQEQIINELLRGN